MQKVILASESPRRRELLSSLNVNYTTCAPGVEEHFNRDLSIEKAVMQVAQAKAEAVLKVRPNDIIIGADTIVVIDNEILGKPKDNEEAKAMLKKLSGRTHSVFTGVSILYQNHVENFYEETKVTFYELEESLMDEYIATKECKDKAGAYGIQGKGSILVKKIEGDYYNVVGLPLAKLYRKLLRYL